MKDIEISLKNQPGALAQMGETLGQHNISLEGGGVFHNGSVAIAHFLVDNAELAKTVLEKENIKVDDIHQVTILKLRQDVPGQLGMFCRKLADHKINILTQYSDHDNQLIIITDNYQETQTIAEEWTNEWWNPTKTN